MKTLKQFVDDHIAEKAALVNYPEAMIQDADNARKRMLLRLKSDPSLHAFTLHYAEAIAGIIEVIPPKVRPTLMLEMFAMAIDEWEDINRRFESQFKPAAPTPVD